MLNLWLCIAQFMHRISCAKIYADISIKLYSQGSRWEVWGFAPFFFFWSSRLNMPVARNWKGQTVLRLEKIEKPFRWRIYILAYPFVMSVPMSDQWGVGYPPFQNQHTGVEPTIEGLHWVSTETFWYFLLLKKLKDSCFKSFHIAKQNRLEP